MATKETRTRKTAPASRFHRIRSLEVEGGFLDGCTFEFDDYLSCLIGGRGTGKTTVIEFLRWALERMPPNPAQQRDIEKLVRNNLGAGTAKLKIETRDGVVYFVERTATDEPEIIDEQGEPAEFSLKKGNVFGVEVYSQNQIEQIADEPRFQLDLIDRFVQDKVEEIQHEIRGVTNQLAGNANELDKVRREAEELREQIRELPDVVEKLKGFATEGPAEAAEEMEREQQRAVLRKQEIAACDEADRILAEGIEGLEETGRAVASEIRRCISKEVVDGPNGQILSELRDRLQREMAEFTRKLSDAVSSLKASQSDVAEAKGKLTPRHQAQDKRFNDLLERSAQEKGRARERSALVRKQADLLEKQKRLLAKKQEVEQREKDRRKLLQKLSQLRDDRHAKRREVADMLNGKLGPTIRVRIEQFGDSSEYKRLLTDAMKGSQLRYASLIERIAARLPPHELVMVVQRDDRKALEDQLEMDADRAARMLLQLQGAQQLLHELEVVELADRPMIELKDGDEYKDSSALSTGQKCTTILPILLLESERPLIVDQPEDNLDNKFIFEAVVKSICGTRGQRQLIFVTHNPNIPVLGEAGRVFVLESTGKQARVKAAGDVDAVKKDIETLLEGGPEAFNERRKRYGY